MDIYSASSLNHQSADRHVAPLGHIILIPSQQVFALTPQCWVLSADTAYTKLIIFGLTWPEIELMIYRTPGEHANSFTTDTVQVTIEVEVEPDTNNNRSKTKVNI